jgi:hypothetical protein
VAEEAKLSIGKKQEVALACARHYNCIDITQKEHGSQVIRFSRIEVLYREFKFRQRLHSRTVGAELMKAQSPDLSNATAFKI